MTLRLLQNAVFSGNFKFKKPNQDSWLGFLVITNLI